MHARMALGLADARALVEGARREAESRKLGVCLAVVDEAGIAMLLERLDGARLHTPDVAWRKARTAAIIRTDTATLQGQVKDNPAFLSFPDRLPVGGGIPVAHEGVVIGAIGCSGGTQDEDIACCKAGIAHWLSTTGTVAD